MRIVLLVICLSILVGCSSIVSKTNPAPTNGAAPSLVTSSSNCPLGSPQTNQGIRLCNALNNVVNDQGRIGIEALGLTNKKYDYRSIALSVLSAAAVAANSHKSVLEGLAIAIGSNLGLRTYAGVTGRRSAKIAGMTGLTCIINSSTSLLQDDNWFLRMQNYQLVLHQQLTILPGLIIQIENGALQGGRQLSDLEVQLIAKAKAITTPAQDALQMGDQAAAAYAMLTANIIAKNTSIQVAMIELEDTARGEVNTIITGILQAQSNANTANNTVNDAVDQINDGANSGTPSPDAGGTDGAQALLSAVDALGATLTSTQARMNTLSFTTFTRQNGQATTIPRTTTEQLATSLATSASAMREITRIAPRYITAQNNLSACVIN